MTLYFFDFTSADVLSRDEEGIDLPDVEAAHGVALDALVDAARDAVQEGSMNQRYAVEVRNGYGAVLEVTAVFNSKFFRRQ